MKSIIDCFVVGNDPETRIAGTEFLERIKPEYRGKVITLSQGNAIAQITGQGWKIEYPAMFLKDRDGKIISILR